ncbi:YdcF family protein [Tropicimonas sp. TH_r6]|uniref:YdcF family protein n=1 Tax=Tropicimonas sp. TH_r6 TaxID=3082085 RepID=UPI002953DA0A|nr:YdcF family protein [Tropicimonas sp. TH_r6]MDV7141422.1 YdcF family protein [Tropicimonas sp. TH_r6]
MENLFFVLSKLVWAVLRPETWIPLGLLVIAILVRRKALTAAYRCTLALLVFVLAIGTFPIGSLLLTRLEKAHAPNPTLERVDGIIVLGGAEWISLHGQPQFNSGAERFTEAMALAIRYPDAKVVFTGGSGLLRDLGTVPGHSADTAELFFRGQGLEPERLLLESASRNTAENAARSLELVSPGSDERWILVTSAMHMPRAMRSFERAGWSGLVAWPVDYRGLSDEGDGWSWRENIAWNFAENLDHLNIATKEYVGALAYDLTGR